MHDMDNGFYAAYQFSGGEGWKATASYPPMLYPTHAVGGVLGVLPTHATSVSCLGIRDDRGDGVFDADVSLWGNEFSNMTALFGLADGGTMRTNEFRRVGHPARVHESRFRFYGTDGVMEQTSTGASWSTRDEIADIGELFRTYTHKGVVTDPTRAGGHRPGAAAQLRVRHGEGARPHAGCRPRSRAPRTGTRAATTSSPTTSSARSPRRPSRR